MGIDSRDSLDLVTPVNGDILERVLKLPHLESEIAIREHLISLAERLGFDGFLYGGRFPTSQGPVDRIITSYTGPWRAKYQQSNYAVTDPTVHHALTSVLPLVWHPGMYKTADQLELLEESSHHGVGPHGVTFPIHAVTGEVSMVCFTINGSERHAQEVLSQSLMWGGMLSTFAHEAMQRRIRAELTPSAPQLTTREIETLKWVAAGKTTWEISMLLKISEHGVVHHVRSVMKKFDVTSRHLAVVRALASGLI